jgi:hypothetical protein
MKRPSLVRFLSGVCLELREVLRARGPYTEGKDEADVRARACCKPNGSLRLCVRDRRITEPGTSSVWASLKIPRFHFRRGPASFSFAEARLPLVVAVFPPPSAAVRSFRHGEKLTMLRFQCVNARTGLWESCRKSVVDLDGWTRSLSGATNVLLPPHGDMFAQARIACPRVRHRQDQVTRCGVSIFTEGAAV